MCYIHVQYIYSTCSCSDCCMVLQCSNHLLQWYSVHVQYVHVQYIMYTVKHSTCMRCVPLLEAECSSCVHVLYIQCTQMYSLSTCTFISSLSSPPPPSSPSQNEFLSVARASKIHFPNAHRVHPQGNAIQSRFVSPTSLHVYMHVHKLCVGLLYMYVYVGLF